MNPEASKYPGFLGAEINPPTAVQPDWVVGLPLRLRRPCQAWINSATRQERLAVGQTVLRRAGHPAGRRRRCTAGRSAGDRRGHPPCEPGARRRVPRLAGPTSIGGEQVSRLPRHRAVPPGRGRAGGVDRAVPLRQRRGPRHVARLRRAPGAARRGREVRRLQVRAPSTTRSAAGSPSTSTATRRRRRRRPRPPSRSGSACTRPSCC